MILLNRRTNNKPIGWASINVNHPLAQNCHFACLCNDNNTGFLSDVVHGLPLSPASSGFSWGTGAGSIVGPKMIGANQGAVATTPSYLKPTRGVSMFWRGLFLGSPAANSAIFVTTSNNTNASPFIAYGIFVSSTNNIDGAFSPGGTFHNLATTGNAAATGIVVDFCLTTNGNVISLYKNGLLVKSLSFTAGNLTYSATSLTSIGANASDTTSPNMITDCAYIFTNVMLTADQVWKLHSDPFGMWPPIGLVPFSKSSIIPPPTPGNIIQRRTLVEIGTRIGTRKVV